MNNGHLPDNPKWTPSWKWVAASKKDVLTFLVAVEPLLKIKQKEARIVIAHLRRYPDNYSGHQGGSKDKRTQRTRMWRAYAKTKERLRTLKTDRHYDRRYSIR